MLKITGSALMLFILLIPANALTAGIKTYYKQYSIFTYENETILCEPYQVQKNDWLYKILRQKGEISETDFPRFLKIFREINPKLDNLDAIEPGIQILIPLKKVDKQAYEQETPGIVKVPVVEFSSVPDKFDITPFIREHTVQPSDTISKLLDKEFLNKGGALSETAQTTLARLNPDIKNMDMIYPGTQVVIPNPSILSQPWFHSFLKQGNPMGTPIYKTPDRQALDNLLPVIPPQQMIRLQRYAALIKGTLIHQGHMHFPEKEPRPDLILDLSKTPILEGPNGLKTLIIPSENLGNALGKDLVEKLKSHWEQLQSQELDMALSLAQALGIKEISLDDETDAPETFIAAFLSITPYAYSPDETISFPVGPMEMRASFGRITRPEGADLLVNFGKVYGLALERLEEKGYEILAVSDELTMAELALMILNRLGYSTWKNPSFPTPNRVETIQGIYAVKGEEKLFIARQDPRITAKNFLEKENIKFLLLTL